MNSHKHTYFKSALLGTGIGAAFGLILGGATGALSGAWLAIRFGLIVGAGLGALTGALTGAAVVRSAGDFGGVSVGAYTGMALGGILGVILGFFIPDSLRAQAASLNSLVLQVITQGRFETAMLLGFQLSVVATIAGAWVGGANFKPRDIRHEE